MRKEHTFRYFLFKNKKCSVLIHRALDQWGEEKKNILRWESQYFSQVHK